MKINSVLCYMTGARLEMVGVLLTRLIGTSAKLVD